MYEGSGTSRVIQVIVGIGLAILSAMCFLVGALGLYAITFQQNREFITYILTLLFAPIGVIGFLMSKRLITAKGSNKGAGILSPNEYKLLGIFFIALSVFMILYGIFHSSMKQIYLSPAPLIISYFCFVAARFRGTMKDVPEWQNKK